LHANDVLDGYHAYALVSPVFIEFVNPLLFLSKGHLRGHRKAVLKLSYGLFAFIRAEWLYSLIYRESVELLGIGIACQVNQLIHIVSLTPEGISRRRTVLFSGTQAREQAGTKYPTNKEQVTVPNYISHFGHGPLTRGKAFSDPGLFLADGIEDFGRGLAFIENFRHYVNVKLATKFNEVIHASPEVLSF